MSPLSLLRTVALKGRVGAAAVAETLDGDSAVVETALADLVEQGLLKQMPSGLKVTPEGREVLDGLLAAERATVDRTTMGALYHEFCDVNAAAKGVFTRWQVTPNGPNDHVDVAYDAAVLTELAQIHRDVVPLVERVAELAPRMTRYVDRLRLADQRIAAGDHAFVTRPIIDSYHTVWFELHEDLISLAGLTRADEAAAGRAH